MNSELTFYLSDKYEFLEYEDVKMAILVEGEDGMLDEHLPSGWNNNIEGLYEESEGMITYDGDLTMEELSNTLKKIGFNVLLEEYPL